MHIYLDMDGVLADFDRGVSELCHLTPVPQGTGSREQEKALWYGIRSVSHFYGKLQLVPGSLEMFRTLYEKYGDACQILTGIPKPRKNVPDAAEDKVNWVRRYLSPDVRIHLVYRAEKIRFCGEKEDILIDDYKKNIRDWEKAGGTGILFRSPAETLEEIKSL